MLTRLIPALALALMLAACASAPPAPSAKPAAAANAQPGCVATPTGLLAAPRTCASAGHTWTQHDIDRTGAPTTAEALRLLDPTITVNGH